MNKFLALLGILALTAVIGLAQQMPSNPQIKITNGPGIDHLTANSAEVFWNTTAKSGSTVHYGTSRNMLTESAEVPGNVTDHKVELKNLQPDTTYYFQVTSAEGINEAKSGIGIFKTHSATKARSDQESTERR